ncbi:MAG: hypothetical protein ACFFAS_00720 [Promethearchaeota archaeon]
MEYRPEKIYQAYLNNELNSTVVIELLISLLEESENDQIRLESIKILNNLGNLPEKTFKFLEHLFVSESNQDIRLYAFKLVKRHFLYQSLSLIKWALQYESNIESLLEIIDAIILMETKEIKTILAEEVRKISTFTTIPSKTFNSRNLFRDDLRRMFKSRKIEEFTLKALSEIYINYRALCMLKKRFFNVQYELKNARVVKLDLSDVEFEVRGWKSEFRNNIKNLFEIPELFAFHSLESLDISNNHLTCVKQLASLPCLSNVNLSNNNIYDMQNIKYFKQLPNLVHLDLQGNKIAQNIDPLKYDLVGIVKLKRISFI